MSKHCFWHGVRMRRVWARPEPDAPPRLVTMPSSWEDSAADALAALSPGDQAVTLADAAEAWIAPLAARAEASGIAIGEGLRSLLLQRRGAPDAAVWRGGADDRGPASFSLNLGAFHDPQGGFDTPGYIAGIETAVTALMLSRPHAQGSRVGLAGLAALLAALGIAYDSPVGRDLAACLAALLRGVADQTAVRLGGAEPGAMLKLPPLPARCEIAGLAEAARCHWAHEQPRHRVTGLAAPGLAEALLGVETGGIAPPFSPITPELTLTATSLLALAGQNLSAESALGQLYGGADALAVPSQAAHAAMHDAVAPFLHAMPPRPVARPAPTMPAPATAARRELPAKRRGYTQRAAIAGHRIYLSTGEYDDGQLGEMNVALPKDSPTVRGLMDSFAQAVSLGLQHGVPLSAFVEAFADTGFGPGGPVEGDPAVPRAASLVDYVIRSLAASYLPGVVIADAKPEPAGTPAETAPLLPLDLPRERRLRLVSSRVGG